MPDTTPRLRVGLSGQQLVLVCNTAFRDTYPSIDVARIISHEGNVNLHLSPSAVGRKWGFYSVKGQHCMSVATSKVRGLTKSIPRFALAAAEFIASQSGVEVIVSDLRPPKQYNKSKNVRPDTAQCLNSEFKTLTEAVQFLNHHFDNAGGTMSFTTRDGRLVVNIMKEIS